MSVPVNRVYVAHGVKVLTGLVGTIGFSRVHGVQGLGVTRFTRFRVHRAAKGLWDGEMPSGGPRIYNFGFAPFGHGTGYAGLGYSLLGFRG